MKTPRCNTESGYCASCETTRLMRRDNAAGGWVCVLCETLSPDPPPWYRSRSTALALLGFALGVVIDCLFWRWLRIG